MTSIYPGLVTGTVVLLLTTPAHAQSNGAATESIEQCRKIADVMDRVACYDRIGESEIATHPAPENQDVAAPGPGPMDTEQVSPGPETSEIGVEDAEYGVLADDVGLPKSSDAYKPILVEVARCDKANNRKWYFYFDNGQVWKYIGNKTLRYRSCNTPAKLVEDGFGFTLQMDGDKAKLRVERVR